MCLLIKRTKKQTTNFGLQHGRCCNTDYSHTVRGCNKLKSQVHEIRESPTCCSTVRVCPCNKFLNAEHREGKVNPAQAAVPLKLGDSCCGLLRGAVQPDLRCTLGPLELTFDLCPAGQETLQYRQAGGPGRRCSAPRAADEQPARAGADYNGADSPPRCSLWPPLRTGTHNTASTSGRHPPRAAFSTCTCLNTPG